MRVPDRIAPRTIAFITRDDIGTPLISIGAVTCVSRIVTADRYAGGIRMRLARFSFAQSNQSDHATTRALAYLFDVDDQRF